MKSYVELFVDENYPLFIDKYLETKTLKRLKSVTQFCGCDYTKLYSPLFLYTRFDHSLVVAHMTWHFTHSKIETIAALLHDVGTPCFAHTIDYVFGDYINQESAEKNIADIINEDKKLLNYLFEDGILLEDLLDLTKFTILENKSPKLCADRLDGVLHTCYIWLHTHSLNAVKEIYDNLIVLNNEENIPEIGFKDQLIGEKFSEMVFIYAKELQGNTDKYVMQYIAEIVKLAFKKNLISLEDLYTKTEDEIINIFNSNFNSWSKFNNASFLIRTDSKPHNFYVSFDTKKRNTIPLIKTINGNIRINNLSEKSRELYSLLDEYHDTKYAYLECIEKI